MTSVPRFSPAAGTLLGTATRAFGEKLDPFEEFRKRYDPEDRLLNDYFRRMLGGGASQ